ncbi:MAG: hypothetical protein ACK4UN_12825 [Limisphaerales bacterium]
MRTHVEFRSAGFPRDPDEEINPGVGGKRLAEYLQRELQKRGIATGDIFSEDWGWVVPLQHDAFPMWVGCGNYQEYEDGYLVFIEPSKPQVRKGWFKKIDTTVDVEKIAKALNTILTTNPEIRSVRWWSEDEK